jgi:hypothetical protein
MYKTRTLLFCFSFDWFSCQMYLYNFLTESDVFFFFVPSLNKSYSSSLLWFLTAITHLFLFSLVQLLSILTGIPQSIFINVDHLTPAAIPSHDDPQGEVGSNVSMLCATQSRQWHPNDTTNKEPLKGMKTNRSRPCEGERIRIVDWVLCGRQRFCQKLDASDCRERGHHR